MENTNENIEVNAPTGGGGPLANSKLAAKAEIIVKSPDGTIKHQVETDLPQEAAEAILEASGHKVENGQIVDGEIIEPEQEVADSVQ